MQQQPPNRSPSLECRKRIRRDLKQMRADPLPLIFPCHRVIGSNGSLTGFGGGLPLKRWLLDFERSQSGLFANAPPQADTRSAMKRSK